MPGLRRLVAADYHPGRRGPCGGDRTESGPSAQGTTRVSSRQRPATSPQHPAGGGECDHSRRGPVPSRAVRPAVGARHRLRAERLRRLDRDTAGELLVAEGLEGADSPLQLVRPSIRRAWVCLLTPASAAARTAPGARLRRAAVSTRLGSGTHRPLPHQCRPWTAASAPTTASMMAPMIRTFIAVRQKITARMTISSTPVLIDSGSGGEPWAMNISYSSPAVCSHPVGPSGACMPDAQLPRCFFGGSSDWHSRSVTFSRALFLAWLPGCTGCRCLPGLLLAGAAVDAAIWFPSFPRRVPRWMRTSTASPGPISVNCAGWMSGRSADDIGPDWRQSSPDKANQALSVN
jgi:hypothetical protein